MKEGVKKRIEGEKNKLKKEKRVTERQNKAMKNMPNRREREEIETLQKELKQVEENLKIKEQRNKLTIERLRKQINEQEKRNEELLEEKENVSQALGGIINEDSHHEEEKAHLMNEERKDSINQKPNIGQKMKKSKIMNFYEPIHEENKQHEIIDKSGTSHSPHFGSQKFDFEDQKSSVISHQEEDNYIKPSFRRGDSEEERSEDSEDVHNHVEEEQKSEYDIPQESNYEYELNKYEMKFPSEYHNNEDSNIRITQENTSMDGKIVRWYENQKKEVIFK